MAITGAEDDGLLFWASGFEQGTPGRNTAAPP
jgi:hypothetical protein